MSLFSGILPGGNRPPTASGPISAAGTSYGDPGPYRSGVWVVLFPDGTFKLMDRASLPPVGSGAKYYWVGSTVAQINSRLAQAIGTLTGKPVPGTPKITQAELNKILQGQSSTGSITPGPGSPASFFGSIADAVTSTLDFLKLVAWIFHPRNILRAVEFLLGLILIIMGFRIMMQQWQMSNGVSSAIDEAGLGRVAANLAASPRSESSEQYNRPQPRRARTYKDVRDPSLPDRPARTREPSGRTRYKRQQSRARRAENLARFAVE